MSRRIEPTLETRVAHADARDSLAALLRGHARAEILDQLVKPGDLRESLRRLRSAMRAHAFRTSGGRVSFDGVVRVLDGRTRQEGFFVLQAWDPVRHRFTTDTNPMLMLDYVARLAPAPRPERAVVATLLDCYLLYLLALMVMRAWDQEDPGRAMGEVTDLLHALQGPGGSGHPFVDDAESLLLLATSQYQPDEGAYDRLLERVRTLDDRHRLGMAAVGAANLGSHLRWGFQFMYRRDPVRMRADNVVDYPWLLFSLATLMEAYRSGGSGGVADLPRDLVVQGLVNGLTADPWAFVGELPSCLAEHRAEHAVLREALHDFAAELTEAFEPNRPTPRIYSPIAFQFNFLHNTLVAKLSVTLLQPVAPALSLNALFARQSSSVSRTESAEILARLLMDFSGADPSRLGARGAVLTVYDPADARRGFDAATEVLEGAG